MSALMDILLDGLVRVVAKDGSVWWVTPASVATYAALDSAFTYRKGLAGK